MHTIEKIKITSETGVLLGMLKDVINANKYKDSFKLIIYVYFN